MPKSIPLVVITALITAAGIYAITRISLVGTVHNQIAQIESLTTQNQELQTEVTRLTEEITRRDATPCVNPNPPDVADATDETESTTDSTTPVE
ncbi:hypothetical protein KKC94_00540 [Patescibacteria group bacterium]|nr:hypothetical protein [Patescibacteria group bacterium]